MARAGGDSRGSSYARRARKVWLLNEYGTGYAVKCHWCPRILDFDTVEADRVIPGEQGGSYARHNIVPACRQCNLARGHDTEWVLDWDEMWESYGLERTATAGVKRVAVRDHVAGWDLDFQEGDRTARVLVIKSGVTREPLREMDTIGRLDLERFGSVWSILDVMVDPAYRRQGVATTMLEYARVQLGEVEHAPDENLSQDGSGWARAVGSRVAYQGQHTPPSDGPPLHDLLDGDTFPGDVYDHPEWYTFGDYAAESIRMVQRVRGNPNATVRIYRSLPPTVEDPTFNTGDWVSIARGYAVDHGLDRGWDEWVVHPVNDEYPMGGVWERREGDWPVMAADVSAHTIRNGGNDLIEWGYHGSPVQGRIG